MLKFWMLFSFWIDQNTKGIDTNTHSGVSLTLVGIGKPMCSRYLCSSAFHWEIMSSLITQKHASHFLHCVCWRIQWRQMGSFKGRKGDTTPSPQKQVTELYARKYIAKNHNSALCFLRTALQMLKKKKNIVKGACFCSLSPKAFASLEAKKHWQRALD